MLLPQTIVHPVGHVGWKIGSESVFAAGVFNGPASSPGENDGNHRARIPPYTVAIDTSAAGPASRAGRALDVHRAVFTQRTKAGGLAIEERWFAPLQSPRLLVHEIELTNSAAAAVTVALSGDHGAPDCSEACRLAASSARPAGGAPDIDFRTVPSPAGVSTIVGATLMPETPASPAIQVALAATVPPSSVTVPAGQTVVVRAVQAIVTSLNSTDVGADAIAAVVAARAGPAAAALLRDHAAAWAARNSVGGIEVEGNLELAQALNASLYFIRASTRADWPYGLSPGGLASDGYGGHTFWDQETWMWPPLLFLDPENARAGLQYRFDRQEGAHNKSTSCSSAAKRGSAFPYCPPGYEPPVDGLMFPWESAATGHEVQSTMGACGPWCMYEQHVSGDIALAVRQYWYATHDRDWLASTGWPLVKGVASFYAARVVEGTGGRYSFPEVMGPDEFHSQVNNSAYTNAVCKLVLAFGVEAAAVLNKTVPPSWGMIAADSGLQIPLSATVPNMPRATGGYHPEYDGFNGGVVKQADTIMLSFPLGVEMKPATLANDLSVYTAVTTQDGPAMTWAVFAVGWMEVAMQPGSSWSGNFSRAAHFFDRGYANVQLPFNVWRETPSGGAVNFITGAGGFLQSALFGSSGMRLIADRLTFNPPPPAASGATMVGTTFQYRGSKLSRRVTDASVTTMLVDAGSTTLTLHDDVAGAAHPLAVGRPVTLPRGRASITSSAN